MEGGDVRGGRRRWKGGGENVGTALIMYIYMYIFLMDIVYTLYIYLLAQHTYIIYIIYMVP